MEVLNYIFNFSNVEDSQAVAKNNKAAACKKNNNKDARYHSFTHFPPKVRTWKYILQYHNPDIYTDIVKVQYISICTRIPAIVHFKPQTLHYLHSIPDTQWPLMFYIYIALIFQGYHINGIIQYTTFKDWPFFTHHIFLEKH